MYYLNLIEKELVVIKDVVCVDFDKNNCELKVGSTVTRKNFPPDTVYFFCARDVKQVSEDKLTGTMYFPEHGQFEFNGSLESLITLAKNQIYGKTVLALPGFSAWRT